MPSAVGFALLSLLFAGLNDVVFKRYSARDRSRGALVFGIGLVWLLLQAVTLLGAGRMPVADSITLGFGIAAGLTLAASNVLLIESLTHVEVGIASTIYRLNTLGVVLLAALFLDEALGPAKAAGIGAGVLAVLLLAHRAGAADGAGTPGIYFGIVVLASLLRAIYGVVSKAGLKLGADADTMLLLAAGSWVIGGALYALLREGRLRVTGKKAAYAVLSGLLVYLIVNFLIAAIARGEASVVIPIANLSFVAALLVSVVLGMERLSGRKIAAVAFAASAIWLLSLQ